jgi:Zn-dependent M28 family amino/carboxypeptidase
MTRRKKGAFRSLTGIGPIVAGLVALALVVPPAGAAPPNAEINLTRGFRKAVTLAGIREHQAAFQSFADQFGGNRVSGGAGGYDASAEYVEDLMTAAGYEVTTQEFVFPFVGDRTPPVLERISPNPESFVDGVDYATMSYSGSGDVTAPLYAVDLLIPSPAANASSSGCEEADFAGFPAGAVALVQRGNQHPDPADPLFCGFRRKAELARAAGASAVIIMNEGNPGRTGLIFGTLNPPQVGYPVLGTTFDLGNELRNGVLNGLTGVTVHVRTDMIAEDRTTTNVIAETPGGDPSRTIVIGAHLDSVSRGPGINDNGSGSGTLLEIAQVFAEQAREARNKLRFMWFGAEEFGLLGSEFYVESLSDAALADIELMLNFDMIGSPNFVRFRYDGDNSAFPPPEGQVGPPGSGAIEDEFDEYFDAVGLANEETPFNGRSDYGPFIAEGIPAGGLFTGAEGGKTPAQALTYGGIAGAQYDPCYHLACDTFAGTGSGPGATPPALGLTALDQMSDAVAHVVLLYSNRNFDMEPLADPAPVASTGTGGAGGRVALDLEESNRRAA